ncbi:MAG: hypothetical protein NWF06_07030 [Candidatus Bathyarchaeota archaeon]|nr:hypothetical protein [Candidatus Bathyarchaeum sp.]
MKMRITLVAIALVGLLSGIAFAGPLVLSELDVKPYISHVQGPTAEFEVETVFANFTVLDPNDVASGVDELSVKYQIWVNVTNPADVNATLLLADFTAAGEITPFSGLPVIGENSSSGTGGTAEGAFVDGKWYNLTWTDGSYPFFDIDGNMCESPFPVAEETGYWMEGVQLYRRYVNGVFTAIYMNMNGTWTDVTGRIEVEEPEEGGGHYVDAFVAEQRRIFQPYQYMPEDDSVYDGVTMYIASGDGYFDGYFESGESRIILIEGVRKIDSVFGNNKTIEVLNSGSIKINVLTSNVADIEVVMENNTMNDTWSQANELKTVELTKIDNSYIYNMRLLEDYSFAVDEFGAEVFLDSR